MTREELIDQANALQKRVLAYRSDSPSSTGGGRAAKAQVSEFLRVYAGPNNAFLESASRIDGHHAYMIDSLAALLQSFIEYARAGLLTAVSPERQARIDVVSDILSQAQYLLDDTQYHAAAAAVLIGGALEEFLRNWVEAEELSIGETKPSIQAYADALRRAGRLDKQEVKNITAWAGYRNDAAHGKWDAVEDRRLILNMLSGVNLLMQVRTTGQQPG